LQGEGGGLSSYLSGKGFTVPEDLKSVVGEYIGENYSFVVSWISNKEEYREGLKRGDIALRVRFSTEKIFYPLKLTSLYGEDRIPVILYVIGWVEPELYDSIKESTKVDHFISEGFDVPSELESFFSGDEGVNDLEYTRLRIYTPSKNLKQDLWFHGYSSTELFLAGFFTKLSPLMSILLFALFSSLSSLISGLVVYKGKVSSKELILLGLSNFLTLVGFSIIALRFLSKKHELIEKGKKNDKRLWLYSLLLLTLLLLIIQYPINIRIITSLSLFLSLCLPVLFLYGIFSSSSNIRGFRNYVVFFSILFLVLSYAGTSLLMEVYKPQVIKVCHFQPSFSRIKLLDYTFKDYRLEIMLTNGVGVRVEDVEVLVGGETEYIDSMPPGGKAEVTFTFLPDLCPLGADYYDVDVNISYNNSFTGLKNSSSGRICVGC